MKPWQIILLVIVIALIAFYIGRRWRFSDDVVFNLPKDGAPESWGPKYWFALHETTNQVPCPDCRAHAQGLMKFMHDVVNNKTGKKIMYPDNFIKVQQEVCKIKV